MPKQKGQFIVFYGVNSLGKTTQAKMLVENLIVKMGKNAEYLKYAVYTLEPSGSLIANYLKGGNSYKFSPREFQLLQVLNRTQYEPKLKEKLTKGTWIVAEDYVGTGIAWGLTNGMNKDLLYKLNSHLLTEDLGILFEGEPFEGTLDKGNLHETNRALLQKVSESFEEIAEDFAWHKINANQPMEKVQEDILAIVKSKLSILE
jgi:thymidylate kinase